MMILSLIENLKNTLEENQYFIYAILISFVLLVVLVVALVIVNSKNKKQSNDQKGTAEVESPEVDEETPAEENPVASNENEEVQDEPSIEDENEESNDDESLEESPVEEVVSDEPQVEEEPAKPKLYIPEVSRKRKSNGKRKKAVRREPRVLNGKYEVYTDGSSYYYNLKASNGEVLIKSEPYASKDSILLAIEAIKRNVEVGSISVREDKHGLYQFVLTAKNHRVLVMSANYSTEKRAESASQSFKRFAPNSPVVEIEAIVESNKEEVKPENIVDKKGGRLGVLSNENGYYYVLKASNGEVLVTSDYFKLESSALNAMARFKEAVFNGKFYIEMDKRENYQFKLFAANGRLVCVGQIYATKALALASLNSVCSFVKLALPFEE